MDNPHRFALLAWQLLGLLDEGKSIAIAEAHQHIDDGSLFVRLRELGGDILPSRDEEQRREILNVFAALSETPDGKFSAISNGIALWLGYCIQVMQRPDIEYAPGPFPPGTPVPGS